MTTTHSRRVPRQLDIGSLTLLLIGLVFGGLSYWLIADRGFNVLIIIPSIVAATTGATHLTKRQASKR